MENHLRDCHRNGTKVVRFVYKCSHTIETCITRPPIHCGVLRGDTIIICMMGEYRGGGGGAVLPWVKVFASCQVALLFVYMV